ncbi:MAG: amino acid permease [Anaerolineae bacterium]|nr:amino acid permease [Anaerolineae bacterium]
MSKRKLKRQLGLAQIVMLGTAGTIGAQIFVLTGEAAALTGPAMLLALLVGGVLTYSIAVNYCEMATSFPETGGAMTYVREAYGNGLLSFLVGSMDCLSSVFFAALSAMGFAYSLNVLLPFLPIVPVAIFTIIAFSILNILGVGNVGNLQILLGAALLTIFGVYTFAGFVSHAGFQWDTLVPGGQFFIHPDVFTNIAKLLRTIALIYIAYVGFEVIADDAEEAQDPERVLPQGILISLTLVIIINIAVVLVALGTIPWQQLAGSKTVLTDTVVRFMPGWGIPMMAIGGLIATLTSINTSMLSATREAFTLSRDKAWPNILSRLSRMRTPYMAILFVGLSSVLITAIGLVDFLSYISSSGYLFVLFWASLAMIRLRKKYPDVRRPFKAPFFPFTAYVAAGTGVLIIVFTEVRALLFGVGLLSVLALAYYVGPVVARWIRNRAIEAAPDQDLILIAAVNPQTVKSLMHLAAIVADGSEDSYVCMMSVLPVGPDLPMDVARRMARQLRPQQYSFFSLVATEMAERNIALYSKVRAANSVAEGILEEIEGRTTVRLLLIGWPGTLDAKSLAENPVKIALKKARTNVAVLLDRGLRDVNRILVPVGGGPHSRMALRLANEIAMTDNAQVTALYLNLPAEKAGASEAEEAEELEDQAAMLHEIVEGALEGIPENLEFKVVDAPSVRQGIVDEAKSQPYDLIVMGASEEWSVNTRLMGTIDDWVAEHAPCSVVLCRRYAPVTISWLRYQVKMIEREYQEKSSVM